MTNANLKDFDDLFQSSEPQANNSNHALQLSVLQPFKKHPFKLYDVEKMQELANSISERGVITPIIVRPIDNDKYEIVSGHNRVEAAKLAGLEIIPCDIRDLDDDTPPTLKDFRKELLRQDEPEAREVALAIELFTDGSLNTFAQQTNVNVNSQYVVYDIKDLGKQLRTIGMLVVLDNIFNRITENRAKGRHTFVIVDEIYLMFQNEYSSNFLFELWKRVRKYGASMTGVTQNVSDLLVSHTARTMLANSEFLIMMNQAPTDRMELANLINISEAQLSHITDNEKAGIGLLKYAGSIVPFEDSFPKDTHLYKLMQTTIGE